MSAVPGARMDREEIYQVLRDAFEAEESGDLATAIQLFKRAARCGSNDARSKLGTIYSNVLTPPELSKAVYWYKSAVKNGDASCAWNLAMHYSKIGRRKGYLYWLKIADEMGDFDAPAELADNAWWNKLNSKLGRTGKARRPHSSAKQNRTTSKSKKIDRGRRPKKPVTR